MSLSLISAFESTRFYASVPRLHAYVHRSHTRATYVGNPVSSEVGGAVACSSDNPPYIAPQLRMSGSHPD